MKKNDDVLSSSQHEFRATSTQVVSLIEVFNYHMNYNVQIDMILLDFSKVYHIIIC